MRWLTLLICGLAFDGCVSVPDHVICQLSLADRGAYCSKLSSPKNVFFMPIENMDRYIMRSVDDEQKLVEYVKRNCNGPAK